MIFFFLGRGRGGGRGGHLTSTTTRLAPSTHFVRPQSTQDSRLRSQIHSTSISNTQQHQHRSIGALATEIERTYAALLPRFYGTRNGQPTSGNDYGNFQISTLVKIF